MRTRMGIATLLGLALLHGCGGNSASNFDLRSLGGRDAGTERGYTLTDLGATSNYYWFYYTPLWGYYRYGNTLRLSDRGEVISGMYGRPAVWRDNKLTFLGNSRDFGVTSAINASGVVVGGMASADTSWYQRTARWANGQVETKQLHPDEQYSAAYGISANGAVVGEIALRSTNDWMPQGYLWNGTSVTLLGALNNARYSRAAGVNDALQVVGWSATAADGGWWGSPTHAVVWQNGRIADLGVLPGGEHSDANDISESGLIVGSSDTEPQGLFAYRPLRATLWQSGQINDLGTLGGPGSSAFGINRAGDVVGSADTATVNPDIPYWGWGWPGMSAGGGTTGGDAGGGMGGVVNGGLGTSGAAPAPGKVGLPVGAGVGIGGRTRSAQRTRGIGDVYVSHAFIYRAGRMIDLNTLIPPASGWELIQAHDINESGQIVGLGVLNKRTHAFLLTPK